MNEIHLVRFLMVGGITLEAYYTSEENARAAHDRAAKVLGKDKVKEGVRITNTFTLTDDFDIGLTVDLAACMAVVITGTVRSARTRQQVDNANRQAQSMYGAPMPGFQPPGTVTPQQ